MKNAIATLAIVALLGTALAVAAGAQSLAHTSFDEPLAGQDPTPDAGDHSFASIGGELGFATAFSETQGPGSIHTLGVYTSPSAPRVFRIRTAEAVTTFDTLDLTGETNVFVTLLLRISSTTWEPGDHFAAVVANGSGGEVTLASFGDVELNGMPANTDLRLVAAIPDAWTQATLSVSGRTNSSVDAEILDYDQIGFVRALVPPGASWRYRDDGSDQGTAWRAAGFADGGWAAGPAQLGYGDLDEATTVAGGPVGNRHITTYFRHHVNVANPGVIAGLTAWILRDDGAVVYLNGTEIYRTNLTPDDVDSLTRASPAVGGIQEDVFQEFPVSADLLVAGDNVLAVEIHQSGPTSSDISFDMSLAPAPAAPPPTLVRRPYLQIGTPTSVLARWRTDIPATTKLRYGPAPGNLASTIASPGYRTEHQVEISGLQPATRYYYAAETTAATLAGDDADHWFETSPLPGSTDPIRIWVIGDSGECGDTPQGCVDAAAVRQRYEDFAGADLADVWLLLGDNAYFLGSDLEYTEGFFEVYPTVMRNTVVWPSPGNHEFGFSDSPTQSGPYYDAFSMPTQGEAGGATSGTEAYYSFDYGNVHFIALDSHDTDRSAPADPVGDVCAPGQGGAMYQWLCADLATTGADFVIVYWHHPPYTWGSHDSDNCDGGDVRMCEMRARFLPVLDAFGVDLQLTGHSHSYERSGLIDGHYGDSTSFDPLSHVVQPGDGDPAGDGPYQKPNLGLDPHRGSVYSVVGSSSKNSGGLSLHPVMEVAINFEGSLLIDVEGGQLDARFIDRNGLVGDRFQIVKGAPPTVDLAINGDSGPSVVATSPIQLTLDMTSGGNTDPLFWLWAIVVNGQPIWLTQSGPSPTPGVLLVAPPLDIAGLVLLDVPLPSGTSFGSVLLLWDGSEFVAADVISAVVP